MLNRLQIYQHIQRALVRFIEKRLPETQQEKAPIVADMVMIKSDERLENCLDSIRRSMSYLEWMVDYASGSNVNQQCSLHRSFLTKQQQLIIDKIETLKHTEHLVYKAAEKEKFDPQMNRALFVQYIQDSLNVMQVNKKITQKEVEIAEELAAGVKESMRTVLRQFQVKDPEKLMLVAKTMKVLNDGQINIDDIKRLKQIQLNKSLEMFDSKLQERREHLTQANEVIKQLKEFIKKLQEEMPECFSGGDPTAEEKFLAQQAKRMARADKAK